MRKNFVLDYPNVRTFLYIVVKDSSYVPWQYFSLGLFQNMYAWVLCLWAHFSKVNLSGKQKFFASDGKGKREPSFFAGGLGLCILTRPFLASYTILLRISGQCSIILTFSRIETSAKQSQKLQTCRHEYSLIWFQSIWPH
jgi:hypothetical protein